MLPLLKFRRNRLSGYFLPGICTLLSLLNVLAASAQVTPTSAEDRLKGLQQRKVLEERSVLKDVAFRNIGPAVMSGRVVDLDVNPADPTEFYVAYATGGLWYTTNNGQSFTPVFDSADVIGIGDVAVNWKTRTIWLGTGEVNSSRSSYSGIGIFKSSDNGKHWEYLGLPETHHIGKIQLHPTDNNTAWVAALGHLYTPNKDRGVFKTTDGGATWNKILNISENTGISDIEMDPHNPDVLYVTAYQRRRHVWTLIDGGPESAIYKTTDAGKTFNKINNGLPGGDLGRIGLAISPVNPDVVYASEYDCI